MGGRCRIFGWGRNWRLLVVPFITGALVLGGESGANWVLDLSMVLLALLRPARFILFETSFFLFLFFSFSTRGTEVEARPLPHI